jgi:hypothetical protein
MKKLLSNYLTLCLLVVGLLISSCSDESQGIRTNSNLKKSENFISLTQAKEIALNLRFSKGNSKLIGSIKPLKDHKGQSVFYVVNYKGEGFVLIAADNRSEPILGYSESNNFKMEDLTSMYPEGLQFWIQKTKADIQELRMSSDKQTTEVKNLWKKENLYNEIFNNQVLRDTRKKGRIDFIGPLTTTRWRQTGGFNALLPTIKCNDRNKRVYSGCLPIAVAQFMKYYKKPSTYAWSKMPNNTPSVETKQLIKDIHDRMNQLNPYTIKYKCNVTTMGYYPMANLLKQRFSYRNLYQGAYDEYTLVNKLKEKQIVLLSGNDPNRNYAGHMWICDGFKTKFKIRSDGRKVVDHYEFHMNWGWGGYSNGWFSSKTLGKVGGYNFNHRMLMTMK